MAVLPSSGPWQWSHMDPALLVATRSRKVCLTCHGLPHHAGPNCTPRLSCQLHQKLIAHGEQLTHRCQGCTNDLSSQSGWAPEVA